MAKVFVSCVVNAPVGRVWALIRDFNGLPGWTPFVAESRIELNATADQIGCVRNFRLKDGGRIRERLLALSDYDFSMTYSILESPMAVTDYVATLKLIADHRRRPQLCRMECGVRLRAGARGRARRAYRPQRLPGGTCARCRRASPDRPKWSG